MRAAPFLVCFFLFSCSPPTPPGVEPEPDAPLDTVDAGTAASDAGTSVEDAGLTVEDAGARDAGLIDAGLIDAGTDDAGVIDAGPTPMDAGTDAGVVPVDAGVDAGQPCTCVLPAYCANHACVVDSAAPVITVTAAAGSTAGKLRVAGTAVDLETGITSVSVRVNQGTSVSVPVSLGAFSVELDTTDLEFTVLVTGRDAAGNEGSAQATFDPTAPRLSLTPADGACDQTGCHGAIITSATTTFTITATVDDFALASPAPVTIRVATSAGTQLVAPTNMILSGSTWTWTWTNFPTLDNGEIDFVVTAMDAAGNVSTGTVHAYLDRVGPPLTVTPTQDGACDQSGCSGAVITATNSTFTFSGTTDSMGVRVRIRDGATILVPSTDTTNLNQGAWSWTWTSAPLVDGRPVTAEFTAWDRFGNTTTVSRVVLVDRVPPSLLVNAPATGALVGAADVSVAANVIDGFGIKAVEVTPVANGPISTATLGSSGEYVASVGVPVVDAVEQTLTIRAVDYVGNTRTATRRYVADRVAPVVTIAGQDGDCSGAQCTGLVANGDTSSVAFSGTATDGSALTLQKSIVGTTQLVTSTDPVSGGAWSWAWSSLPSNVNGAAYELRVVATDAAGNASTQRVRRVWLDNVAPTVTFLQAGQRDVSPTAPLLTFSERMAAGSVQGGVAFMPTVDTTTLATTDGRTFAFSSPVLSPYTSYHLSATNPTDLAGNALSAGGGATFLTAPVERDAVTVIRQFPGVTYRYPVVAIDSDEQIYASYIASSLTGTFVESRVFDGAGRQTSRANTWGSAGRIGELRITSEGRGPDQRLAANLEHTFVLTTASGASVGYGTQTMAWTNQAYDASSFVPSFGAVSAGGTTSSFDLFRPTMEWVPSVFGSRRTMVAPNNGATAMNSVDQGSPWTTTSIAALTNLRRVDGRASVEATGALGIYRVRYYDFGAMSEVGSYTFVRAVTGQPASKGIDRLSTVATSGSFMAWMSDTQLTIACSPAPFLASPTWRTTSLPMPQTHSSSLTSVKDASRVVFASEFGGNVYVHSTPLNGCTAAPTLTQLGVIPGLKEPSLAIDSRGKAWVVGIATDGAVVLHRL